MAYVFILIRGMYTKDAISQWKVFHERCRVALLVENWRILIPDDGYVHGAVGRLLSESVEMSPNL